MSKTINKTEYTTFNDILNDNELLSDVERDLLVFEISFIKKLVEARDKMGLSQKQLALLTGLKQPAIARLESMKVSPQINTLFRILKPLGYTLAIVPDNPHKL